MCRPNSFLQLLLFSHVFFGFLFHILTASQQSDVTIQQLFIYSTNISTDFVLKFEIFPFLHGRCDLIGVGVFSGHGIRMPWTPALYISSMVLSLVAVRAENVLINYSNYVDEVISEEKVSLLVFTVGVL